MVTNVEPRVWRSSPETASSLMTVPGRRSVIEADLSPIPLADLDLDLPAEELLVEDDHAVTASAGSVSRNWVVTIFTASAMASAETRPS